MPPKPPESDESTEAPDDGAMDRFKSLAKGLVNVSRDDLAEQERRWEAERKAARVAPRDPPVSKPFTPKDWR